MKKRFWFILIGIVFLLIIIAAGIMWYEMQQPLYQPGMLHDPKNLAAPLTPPAQPVNSTAWLVEPGISLNHFSDGNGTPILVIHGGPGSPFTEPVAGLHELAGNYRFEYYDQRGCGGSTRPIEKFESSNMVENMSSLDKKLGIAAQIADIERIRQILGQEKITLVGHSFGGFLAALYAAEFPEHVQSLILISPAEMLVMPNPRGGLYEEIKPLLPQTMRPAYDDYLKRYFDFNQIFKLNDTELTALNQEFIPYYTAVAAAKGFNVPQGDLKTGGGWMVWGMYVSLGQQHDYRSALSQITAPTLVLHGSLDIQTPEASRDYANLIPQAEFNLIDGAGHFPFIDQPQVFAKIVNEFLSRHQP